MRTATSCALVATLLISICGGLSMGEEMAETFGCEANPTGDPIGGGPGYRDIKTKGDFTVRTAEELLAALKKAKPGQVIFVPDGVEIDLAGHEEIPLPGGVTLASTRGKDGSPGAQISMKQKQKGIYYLFHTAGENVRLTGLLFEGPDGDNAQRNGYSHFLRTTHYGLEVDNCEIANWGYSAVSARLGASRLRVHHCSVHHCVGAAHDGYGVSLDQCDAYVIANKFAVIRNHAISGTGRPGTAYQAAYNFVEGNFDMHGGGDRGDGTSIAGDWTEIHHNTFKQVCALTALIRGISSQGNKVHHNWFMAPLKESIGYSKGELAKRNVNAYRNVYGAEKILEE